MFFALWSSNILLQLKAGMLERDGFHKIIAEKNDLVLSASSELF